MKGCRKEKKKQGRDKGSKTWKSGGVKEEKEGKAKGRGKENMETGEEIDTSTRQVTQEAWMNHQVNKTHR